MMSASKTLKKNLSIAVATVFLAVAAFSCWAIEPSKAYANTTDSHLTVASEVHVLVDSEGNVTIPNATVTNDGTCAAYIMGCSSPDGLSWTCDAVGKRIEVGQSITATWRSAGPVSDEIAAQLGEEPYYAGNLTYTYTDGDLKGTVSLDNTDPTVGDTITATVTGANVPDDKLTYQWYKVKDGVEAAIDGATGSTYTATDDDAGYELVCKVSSTDDICLGTICGVTGAVKKIQAFAVYSADDGSLNFYRRAIAELPSAGEQFEGKTTTAVYTGIEDTNGSQPWSEYMSDIKTATVVDSGIQPKNTAFWFSRCANMTQFDASKLDVSQTTNMMLMFSGCSSLTDLSSLAGWDTSQVTDMGNMFSSMSRITDLSSISGWNTSSVTNMGGMLAGLTAPIALDLSNWDTSNVTNMGNMFSSSSGISTVGDLSNWDTSKVTTMDSMFYGCSSLTFLALSGWDTSKVSNMDNMCDFCNNLEVVMLGDKWQWVGTKGYLPTPDPQYITGADGKWYDADGNGYAPADIPSNKAMTYYASKDLVPQKTAFAVYSADDNSLDFYKRTEVPTAGSSFEGKTVTAVYTGIEDTNGSQPWSNYKWSIKTATVVDDGIQPKSTARWFASCTYMTQCNMSTLDTSNTINTSYMFLGAGPSTLDLSGWDTSNLTDTSYMFNGSSLKTIDLSSWDTSKVTTMVQMFYNCPSLTTIGNLSGWDTSKVTNMCGMFFRCSKLTTLDISGWNTSNLTYASSVFENCSSLTTLDLSGWDTSNVTDMSNMFNGCSSLTTIGNLSGWDTSKVTTMNNIFLGCSSLTTLDLSGWDTSKVTAMRGMFRNCSKLTTLDDLPSWDTSKVNDMNSMFLGCSKLSVNCSNWDVSKVIDHSNYRSDFNTDAPGVILPLAWQTSSDEGVEDSTIAPLCEEQGNRDALSVPSENGNDEAASKTDGEASADSETEGSNTASADDAGAKEEEASGDIVQEEPTAA